jgi:hypothetical protein
VFFGVNEILLLFGVNARLFLLVLDSAKRWSLREWKNHGFLLVCWLQPVVMQSLCCWSCDSF